MNTKKTLIGVFVVVLGLGLSSFKDDDRNFQIAKNLDIYFQGARFVLCRYDQS